MKNRKRAYISVLFLVFFILISISEGAYARFSNDTTFLRVSIHVFDNQDRTGNFHPDSLAHTVFLEDVLGWINHRMLNLDTLKPEVPSHYIKSIGVQIRIDSFYYHTDDYAWDCSEGIDSDYMRKIYVDQDSSLSYTQKFRTLPVFLGGNYSIVGGHNSLIGDKWFIAMRGVFSEYLTRPYHDAVRDCGRGLLHELCHSLGLIHNFQGGPHGDQCDYCEDNGCPAEGSSNNIMDYWPSYGYALSACQKGIIRDHLNGLRGNISEVIWNDSCYTNRDQIMYIEDGEVFEISDTSYIHSDLVVENGGSLIVNSYLSVPDSCSVIIEAGANMEVIGGTLGNLCGDIWNGVIIMRSEPADGGKIVFYDARIENAGIGITSEYHTNMVIRNAEFINNLSSLKFLGWSGQLSIEDCSFEIQGRLNHWEEGQVPESFVQLENSENIDFTNCSFYNYEGHRNYGDLNSGIGFIAYNAGLKIRSCTFKNLYKAVVCGADYSGTSLSVDSCSFVLNHCNIQIAGLSEARVSSSYFNLNRLNTLSVYGIVARKSRYLEVYDNVFYSDYGGDNLTGIVSEFDEPGTHLIHNNEFSLLDEGIVVLNTDSLISWPSALHEYLYDDLIGEPLGSIWFSNQFRDVKKQVIIADPETGGLLRSSEGAYELYSVDWSNSFKGAGFSPFSNSRDLCIIKSGANSNFIKPSGLLFDILSVESWYQYDNSDFDTIPSQALFSSLRDEYYDGMLILERNLTGSHKGYVSLASHLETYPWIACLPRLEDYLDREIYSIPAWLWIEIKRALERTSWWKNQLHQFIISLAKDQLQDIEKENIKEIHYSTETFNLMAFSQVDIEISTDIGRLNPGINFYSSLPRFSIVPNPSDGKVGIKFGDSLPNANNARGLEWIMHDMTGRVVLTGFISAAENLIIDAAHIPPGSYLLEIWNENEFLGRQKFIILPD